MSQKEEVLPEGFSTVSVSLRHDATYNHYNHLRDVLRNRPNTCEADEFGLTALMLAVWNGHVECVKYLVCNDIGVDLRGIRVSALHLKSCKGYTALHLSALDALPAQAKEITCLLLVAGLRTDERCNDGFTPEELAVSQHNQGALDAFREFRAAQQGDETLKAHFADIKAHLLAKYCFIHNPTMNVEKWEANFPVPDFIYKDGERVGALPEGMTIHEHQIQPLIDEGFERLEGKDAYNCLDFTINQAEVNQMRRMALISASDKTWEPVDLAAIIEQKKMKKKRGSRRKPTIEEVHPINGDSSDKK